MSKIRNIYIIAITLVLSFIFQINLPKESFIIVLAVVSMLWFYIYFIRKKHREYIIVSLLSLVFSIFYFNIYSMFLENTVNDLTKENSIIEGYVTEINTDYSFGNRYTIKVDKIQDENTYQTFVYIYSFDEFSIGKELVIIGQLNENSFSSYSNYLFTKNIFGTFNTDEIITKDTNKIDVNTLGALIKQEITKNMQKLYSGDVLALALSMGYSDKSLVSDEILEDFSVSGLSHMLVVSGLHVGIISLFLNLVFKYIPIKKKIKNIILIFCLLFLAMIIGFTYSISRAVFIMIILLILRNFKLYPDTFSSLSLIIIFTIIQNPYAVYDIGLLLSYTAFIGIIIGANYIENKNYNKILSAVILSAFAVLFTIPILSFAKIKMTILSPLINPMFSLLILPVSIFSFFTPILHFIPILNPINNILVLLNTFFINIFIDFSSFIGSMFHFSLINISHGILRVLIISIIVSSLFYIISFGYNKKCKFFVISACIISILCYNFISYNTITITMIDTGRFVSSTIRYDNSLDLILKENISEKEITYILKDENKSKFNNIIICFDEELEFNIDDYSNNVYLYKDNINYEFSDYSFNIENENIFKLNSNSLNVITSKFAQDINEDGIYFLASNPPINLSVDEIYYYQNGVLSNAYKEFINLKIGTRIYDDFKINVNLINGKYYIVKDVINFANWI